MCPSTESTLYSSLKLTGFNFWPQAKTSPSLTVISPAAKPTACHLNEEDNQDDDDRESGINMLCRIKHSKLGLLLTL